MRAILCQTNKRINSTSQTYSNAINYEFFLKEDTSIYNPTIIVNSSLDSFYNRTLNYAVLFGNYYWITDIRSINNTQWEIDLEIDVLASFKSSILNNYLFIERSSKGFDTSLPDPLLSQKSSPTIKQSASVMTWTMNGLPSDEDLIGYYCITYIGEGTSTFAYVKEGGLRTLQTKLASQDSISAFGDLIGKVLGDTGQCITSCRYVHHIKPTNLTNIVFPNGYVAFEGAFESERVDSGRNKVTIPWAYDLGDFRNRSEYTSIILKLPFYGIIEIDPMLVFDKSEITIEYSIDCVTADLVYTIPELGYPKYQCNIGFEVQLSTSSSPSLIDTIGSVVDYGSSVATSFASGNAVGGVAEALTGGIDVFKSGFSIKGSCVGGNTSVAGIDIDTSNFEIMVVCYPPVEALSVVASQIGRPLHQWGTLSYHSGGYVKTRTNTLSLSQGAPPWILEKIIDYLNSGVFLQ